MNNFLKDKINKSYAQTLKAMENMKSKKYIRLSLLECAALLEEHARLFPNEKTKSNALGFKLVELAKKLGNGETVDNVYFLLTGKKINEKTEEIKKENVLDDFENWMNEIKNPKIEESAKQSSKQDIEENNQIENEAKNDFQGEEINANEGNEEESISAGSFSKSNNKLRVQTLEDYVGQEQIKPRLKEAIMAAKKRREPLEHILMFGSAGLGKTTLAKIIANEMGGECIIMSGPTIKDADSFIDIIKNVKKGDVVFIDEIHRISTAAAESIYTAMEDFELSYLDKKRGGDAVNVTIALPQFTLIGATTHSGLLTKPMRDRFALQFKLEPYTLKELAKLATLSMSKFGFMLSEDGAIAIAKRSRGVPRICNGYVKRIRDKAELLGVGIISAEIVDSYFEQCGIDENGLEEIDLDYLKAILFKFDGGPVGIDTLCSVLGEGRNIIEQQIEPYLIYLGLISVSSGGREITSNGKRYLDGDKTNIDNNSFKDIEKFSSNNESNRSIDESNGTKIDDEDQKDEDIEE